MNATRSVLLMPNHSVLLDSAGARLESSVADLLRELRTRFEAADIAAFASHGEDPSLSGTIRGSEATFYRLNRLEHGSLPRRVLNYLVAASVLPFVLRRYDLLYIFCPGHCGWLAALWARVLGKRYGLYVRGTWLNRKSATSFLWRRVFAGASFMIVTGEAFRRRLIPYCNNVVNEVPLTALRPTEIGSPDQMMRHCRRLLFAGRLTESKGMLDVVRAVALLRAAGQDIELTIAGGGLDQDLRKLAQLCDDLGVRTAVTMLGHVTPQALAAAYRGSAVFVFPSYYPEGFPRVLYEAMMFSLPIVTCDMPGIEGFLVDDVNCLLCPPSDPVRLAANIRRLLSDAALAQRLGCRARADVERLYESFSDASHAQQVLRFVGAA